VATRTDLLRQLAVVADDLGPVVAPADLRKQLTALCRTVRLALDAESVSIARLDGNALVYDAAEGRTESAIVGTRLVANRGIAGYVAGTGQSLVVDSVAQDPRFARDVAERVGYIPSSMVVVPVMDAQGEVAGVLAVLDRTMGSADALAVTSAAAEQAAEILPLLDAAVRFGALVLAALSATVDQAGRIDLAELLRRESDRLPEPTQELAKTAALLAQLRSLPPGARDRAERLMADVVALAGSAARTRIPR
jgi:putative methionine-R-sulfoxide reductase with GAF domain